MLVFVLLILTTSPSILAPNDHSYRSVDLDESSHAVSLLEFVLWIQHHCTGVCPGVPAERSKLARSRFLPQSERVRVPGLMTSHRSPLDWIHTVINPRVFLNVSGFECVRLKRLRVKGDIVHFSFWCQIEHCPRKLNLR